MSLELRCDFCDRSGKIWQLRKKFSLFKWEYFMCESYKKDVDICDVCLDKILKAKNTKPTEQ